MSDPRRLIAAADRLVEVLGAEFPDLNPAETHFVLTVLASTHTEMFLKEIDRRFEGIEPRRGAFRTAGSMTGRLPQEPHQQ